MNNFTTIFLFTHNGTLQYCIIIGEIILYFTTIGFLCANLLVNLQQKPKLNGRIFLRNYNFSITSYLALLVYVAILLPLFMFLISASFGTTSYIINRDAYSKLQDKYNSQKYFVAEGVVQVLHEQNYWGHDQSDIIRVGNTEFEIDAYSGGWSYGKTISHGGALSEGTYARIFYVESPFGNVVKNFILRVDIR